MDVYAKVKPIIDRNLRLEGLELSIKYKVSEKQLFSRRFQTLLIHNRKNKPVPYDEFVQQAYALYKDDEQLKKTIEKEVRNDIEFRTLNRSSNDLIHQMKTKKINIVIKDK